MKYASTQTVDVYLTGIIIGHIKISMLEFLYFKHYAKYPKMRFIKEVKHNFKAAPSCLAQLINPCIKMLLAA